MREVAGRYKACWLLLGAAAMTRTPAPALLAALAVQLGLSLGHLPELHHLTQEQRAEERCRVSEVGARGPVGQGGQGVAIMLMLAGGGPAV